MSRMVWVAVASAVLVGTSSACGGAISQNALDARAGHLRACDDRAPGERASCVGQIPPLTQDEPTTGPCMAHVDGERWAREAAPSKCDGSQRASASRARATCLAERTPAGTSAAEAAVRACQDTLRAIDEQAACLRAWKPGYANVHGLSLSCFVDVEQDRTAVTERIASLEKALAGLRQQDADRDAAEQKKVAESKRQDQARALIAAASEECRKGLLDHTPKCEDAKLTGDEKKACSEGCRVAGLAEGDRTFSVAIDACVEAFANTGIQKPCAVTRPSEGPFAGAEFDKRMQACSAECKKKGPAARAEALAEKAKEDAERRRGSSKSGARGGAGATAASSGTQASSCCAKCGGRYSRDGDSCAGTNECFMCCMGQIPSSAPVCNGWR